MRTILPGGWNEVRARNHALAVEARNLLADALDITPPCPEAMLGSIATLHLPEIKDLKPSAATSMLWLDPIQEALFHDYKIEVPVLACPESGRRIFRISAQLYNELDDYERLARALKSLCD
jgi:isopenicillin-N epimerase